MEQLSREIALIKNETAIIYIDVQNLNANPKAAETSGSDKFFKHLKTSIIPNMQKLQLACRGNGVELIYTNIESLTIDGRDRSLDYKISGFNVPKGSWEAQVIDELKPAENEIYLPKTSSSVFISTNIDYVLRNLGIKQVMLVGLLTDQCVESAVRDACDMGYLVTLVTDACATYTKERHENSLKAIKGYCRQVTTQEVLAELNS